MNLKEECSRTLSELSVLIGKLDNEQYASPLPILSGNSIGKHIRHIVEFYQCLLSGLALGEINYDARQRDGNLEMDPEYTTNFISSLVMSIRKNANDQVLVLVVALGGSDHKVNTTYYRELAYNIEHAVHHLAIIKIAILQCFPSVELPIDFGVAHSTVQFEKKQSVKASK